MSERKKNCRVENLLATMKRKENWKMLLKVNFPLHSLMIDDDVGGL